MNWYYRQDGRPCGPVSEETLAQMVADGRLSPGTSVWRDGFANWVSAVSALASPPASATRVAPPPVAPLPVAAARTLPAPAAAYARPAKPNARPSAHKAPVWIAVGICAALLSGVGILVVANLRKSDAGARSASEGQASQQTVAKRAEAPSPSNAPVSPPAPRAEKEPIAAAAPKDDAPEYVREEPLERPRIGGLSPIGPENKPAEEAAAAGAASDDSKPEAPEPAASPAATSSESSSKPAAEESEEASAMLFQELRMKKVSRFDMEGLSLPQQSEFRVLSELAVSPESEAGLRDVVQTVLDTRLESADDAMRATIGKSLEELHGKKLVYKVDRRGEVVEFKSDAEKAAATPLAEAGGVDALGGLGALEGLGAAAGLGAGKGLLGADGFASSSVMDDDGWQELAEYTFFRPDQEFRPGKKLTRQRTHDWGPLGAWEGETTFTWQGEKQGAITIAFLHALTYKAPVAGAGAGSLGLDIVGAEFAPPAGRGGIVYDQKAKRVVNVEEQFAVRGAVAANLLGTSTRLQIEEQQQLVLWIFDQNPWRNE